MGTTFGIIIGILILSLLMFIHELGHYLTGRLLGFKIIEFSLFMGPVLLSKTSKKTGIKYSLKLLPIGASVRFEGESGMGEEDSDNPDAFNKKAKWKRAIVIGTGPVINIIAGIAALLILFSSFGYTSTTVSDVGANSQAAIAGIQKGDKVISVNDSKILTSIEYVLELGFIKDDKPTNIKVFRSSSNETKELLLTPVKGYVYRLGVTTQISELNDPWKIVAVDPKSNQGSPVLKPGDVLVSIDGVATQNRENASKVVSESNGKTLDIVVIRDDKEITLKSTPQKMEVYSDRGISFTRKTGLSGSFDESIRYSGSIIKITFKGLAKIFTGEIAAKDGLSGPVGVVDMIGSVVKQESPLVDKFANILWMFALISLNLGIFNLLPIPALDGSHLLLIVVEAVRGKKLSAKIEGRIVLAGFMFIIALAILGLIFDIMRIASR